MVYYRIGLKSIYTRVFRFNATTQSLDVNEAPTQKTQIPHTHRRYNF